MWARRTRSRSATTAEQRPRRVPAPVDPRRRLLRRGLHRQHGRWREHVQLRVQRHAGKADKRFSKGLTILGNYTWGKCMDNQSSLAEGKYQDIFNLRADWSRCSYDIAHAFKLGYVYDLPFGRGRTFGGDWNRFVDGVLGGWAVEGIVHGSPARRRTSARARPRERRQDERTPERPPQSEPAVRPADSGSVVRHGGLRHAGCLHVGQRGRLHGARRRPARVRRLASRRSSASWKDSRSSSAASSSTSRTTPCSAPPAPVAMC
jgi:hypothetical protein